VPRVSSFELPISASHNHLLRVLPVVGCRSKTPTQGSGCRGGCIFIWQGAFLTMEHLLAMMVSVPRSLGRMHIHSARGISDNGALAGDDG
jgi:hypothetical protein